MGRAAFSAGSGRPWRRRWSLRYSPPRSRRPVRLHPVCARPSSCWRASVRSTEGAATKLAQQRSALSSEVDEVQRHALADDAEGQRLLTRLDATQPGGGQHTGQRPRSDPHRYRSRCQPESFRRVQAARERSRQIILDRDLQLVVNSLWASGAEAISVGGARIGPNVDDPASRRCDPGRQQPHQQPLHDPRGRSAARDARRLRPQPRTTASQAAGGFLRCRRHRERRRRSVAAAGSIRDVKFAKQIGP